MRDLGVNIVRALKVSTRKTNMAARYIARLLPKRCVKNGLTQYIFSTIESGVSSNCTCNIHKPSTPKKEVNRKTAKRR